MRSSSPIHSVVRRFSETCDRAKLVVRNVRIRGKRSWEGVATTLVIAEVPVLDVGLSSDLSTAQEIAHDLARISGLRVERTLQRTTV